MAQRISRHAIRSKRPEQPGIAKMEDEGLHTIARKYDSCGPNPHFLFQRGLEKTIRKKFDVVGSRKSAFRHVSWILEG